MILLVVISTNSSFVPVVPDGIWKFKLVCVERIVFLCCFKIIDRDIK